MSNATFLKHSARITYHLLWMMTTLCLVTALYFSTSAVKADEIQPDPRFGIVESYQAPDVAGEWNVGWDRIVVEWYRVQPLGPNSWIPVYPHGLDMIESSDSSKYRNNIEHSVSQSEWLEQAGKHRREIAVLLIGTPEWATKGLPHRGVPDGLYLPVSDPDNNSLGLYEPPGQ